MKKNLIFRLFLTAFLFTMMYSCRTEEELKSHTSEVSNVHYGISGDALLSTQFFKSLKSNNSKVASSLSPEELVERLDLDKAHLNSKEGKEVLQVPVRTFGSYKRTLFSVTENNNSSIFLFTYPDPNDSRLFYITDLDGNLVKEVKIGDDGKELTTTSKFNTTNVAGKNECEEVIYETCSSGQHSFETGNAYQCEFWHNLTKGTPPKLFRVSGICNPGGSSGSSGGSGGSGGHPAGGSTTTPVGGGGPPKHQITPADCVQNLDCGSCNIPGDFNNDCKLSYDEVMAFNNDPCRKTKNLLENTDVKAKITELKIQSTLGGEKGVKFEANGTPSATISGGAHSVNFGDKTGYVGGYHNHTPTGIPMLSVPDIDQLLGFARAQPTYADNTNNAFVGMVAPNGMHYVIWFKGTYQDAVTNFSQQDLDKYIKKYIELESNLTDFSKNGMTYMNNDGSINNLGVEKLFLETLKNMGLNGKVNLQRIEIDDTVKNINLDSNNQPVPTTC